MWSHENSIQENPKGNESEAQCFTRQDRASRRDWLPKVRSCLCDDNLVITIKNQKYKWYQLFSFGKVELPLS